MTTRPPSPEMPARSRALAAGLGRAEIVRVSGETSERVVDAVAVEEPLEIRVSGDTYQVTMRTPGHDFELVAGLLFGEGVIEAREQLSAIAHCGRLGEEGARNVVEVTPGPGMRLDFLEAPPRRVVSSACGVCGRATIDDLVERLGPRDPSPRFRARWLAALPEALAAQQPNFARTGALHAAGAAAADEPLSVVREDVGRHNAVDKVVGRLVLDGRLPLVASALVVSGRASFEIVQKAIRAGFSALVCVSAPSSLAIETAARFGLVLIGFARGAGFNVYSGADRLT